MGSKYSSQSTSGYNSGPPPDDGTQVASNLVTWADVKTKLADVLKTFAEAINTALVSALDLSARAISSNDTAVATDHWKTLQVTGATTISLSSAASMGAGYEVQVFNAGTGVVTVTPAGSDTINLASNSVTIPIKRTMIFRTNQGLTGYNITAGHNWAVGNASTYIATVNGYGFGYGDAVGGLILYGQGSNDDLSLVNKSGQGAATIPTGTRNLQITAGVLDLSPSGSGQIQFPATQNASAGANVLDDYEEGTWTPNIGGTATYTTQAGFYTKIGRIVHINGVMTINSLGTGSINTISGLPFTSSGSSQSVIAIGNTSSLANTVVSLNGFVNAGVSTILILSRTAASVSDGTTGIFGNGANICFGGSYIV